jgi:LacI family transcriptional regulator
MANVSIKQIADLAGVSRGTVDRALNDRYGIDPDLKARILKIAADLGYRSNRAGKMLSIRKSPLRIGVQMPSVGNDFFLQVEEGLQAAAKAYEDFGLTLVIRTMKGFDAATQIAQVRELVEEGIHGLALVPINHPDVVQLLADLAEQKMPVITFNTDLAGGRRLGYVGNDYWRSGATAAGVLRLLCHGQPASVAILTGSVQMLGHNQRICGFTHVIRQECPRFRFLTFWKPTMMTRLHLRKPCACWKRSQPSRRFI